MAYFNPDLEKSQNSVEYITMMKNRNNFSGTIGNSAGTVTL